MSKFRNYVLLLALLVTVIPAVDAATSSVYLVKSGSTFVLRTDGFSTNIGSYDITVNYNPASVLPPVTVTFGASFFNNMTNTETPGSVRVVGAAGNNKVSGSFEIARVSFAGTTGLIDKNSIWIQSHKLNDMNGLPVGAVNAGLVNPDLPVGDGGSGGTDTGGTTAGGGTGGGSTDTGNTGGTATGTGTPTYLGTVTTEIPQGTAADKPREETKPRETADAQAPPTDRPAPSAATEDGRPREAAPEKPRYTIPAYAGVLAAFRQFKGEASPKAMIALATAPLPKGLRQEPAIALSDGKTPVKVRVLIPADAGIAPTFALRGAKLLSLNRDGDEWVVESLPKINAHDVTLSVFYGDATAVVPLTVTPSLELFIKRGLAMDEKGFALFLKERGTDKAPRFDLNNDGKRDYADDYIYTLNYLLRLKAAPAPKK